MQPESRRTPGHAQSTPPSTVKDAVRDRFSSVAANYAGSVVHAQGDEFGWMLDLASLTGSESVLDAGCGPGHTAITFAPHARHVVAVDLSGAMLEQGRTLAAARQIANVDFREGDVESLPFADASFDLVVTRYSAHHWPAPQSALAEFRRVLRSDGSRQGRLLLADVVSFEDYTVDTHLQAIELLRDPSHVRDHTPGEWLSLLAAAGFRAEVKHEWHLRLDFESWVARMQTPEPAIAMIRSLLAGAPLEVQSSLRLESDSSFSLRCALFHAVPVS